MRPLARRHHPLPVVLVSERIGLLLDPYFSGTKIAWLLDHVDGARTRAEAGDLCFGTVDSFLIWRLTGGRVHATDATNASRTLLYDIRNNRWDPELCTLLGVPMAMLPEVRDSAADFGTTEPEILGAALPILGVAGDQQAATIGQACFAPGMMKSTYGTGCFALLNTGSEPVASSHRMLTTIAYRLDGRTTYALEGSIFIAGAVVQWLRDGLGVIASASETQALAEASDPGQQVYVVPAFTGLGAPWWDSDARGALYGLTRNTGPRELARAALRSRAAGRRRHDRERLDAAVPGQHHGRGGRPADRGRDHRAGRGLARRPARRRLARHGGLRRGLAARPALHPGDGPPRRRRTLRRLARRSPAHAEQTR